MAEDLIREMLAQLPGGQAEARGKIETLAVLQFMRGHLREMNSRTTEELRKLRETQEKLASRAEELIETVRVRNEAAEARQEEIREMEARLSRP